MTIAFASLGAFLTASTPIAARAAPWAYVEGEVIVRFRPGGAEARASLSEDTRVLSVEPLDRSGADLVRLSGTTTADAVAWLSARADVAYAEPNYRFQADAVPDDSLFSQQWGLDNRGQTGGTPGADVAAVSAWELETGSHDVIVGIVDSGIDLTHPDLAPQLWTNPGEIPDNGVDDDVNGYIDDVHGWDFADDDNDVTDTYGHGTVVAGVIGAAGNDRRGVTGVCWRVALMPLRTINSLGVGDVASAVRAVAYATHMGARLTNNSWGRIPDVRSLRDVIEQARTAGVLFVAAAGNGGLDDDVTPHFPSGYPHDNVLSVAATDENDQLARFSNFGATTVDLAAPGSAILSTFTQGRFISLSGTSLSTPFVSGALALAIARARLVPYGVLRDALLATVDRKPTLAATMVSGGRLNLRRLLEVLDVTPPDPVTGLEVESVPGSRATLRWIAPADGAGGGAVAGYDIRYAAGALDPADLERAAAAPFVGVPGAPGQVERVAIDGLAYATGYTFAVRAVDAFGNRSTTARFVTATTPAAPVAVVTAETLDWTLAPDASAERALTIENRGGSELRFSFEASPEAAPIASAAHGHGIAAEDAPESSDFGTPSRPSRLQAAGGLRVMLLTSGASLPSLLASLTERGLRVDERRADLAPLGLDELLDYDAVVVAPASRFADRTGLGDLLADFVDRGGGVVLTHGVLVPNAALTGRFAPGYWPLVVNVAPAGTTSGTLIGGSTHPLLHGVRYVSSRSLHSVVVATGATTVGSWNTGAPAVATRGANVVALDVGYETGTWGGDAIRLLANAVAWSAHRVSWLTAEPGSGAVPVGGSVRVILRADASGLNGETRMARLVVQTDDPVAPATTFPARVVVGAEPRVWVDGEAIARGVLGPVPAIAPARSFDVASRRGARGIAEYRATSRLPFVGSMKLDGGTVVSLPFPTTDCLDLQQTVAVDPAVLHAALSDGRLDLSAVTPSGPQSCPNGTYRATLYYVTASDTLDFRDAVVGMRDTLRIWVQNTGRTTLILTSIRTGDPELIPSSTQASCGPGATVSIAVRFVPATVGVHDAQLEFATNDPQRPLVSIPIRARVVPRPMVRVDTPFLTTTLFTGGANTIPLRFGNVGQAELTYVVEPPATAEVTTEGLEATTMAATWLRVLDPSGVLPIGADAVVPVVVDAAGMPRGTVTAVLTLVTNDPLATRTSITVRMQVLGSGRMTLGGPPIELESIETFTPPSGETRHAFRLDPPPAAGADLQCLLEGDSPAGLSSVTLDVDGRYQIDLSGAALPCTPRSGSARLDAGSLRDLLDDGAIDVRVIRTSPASTCPSWRHIVRWRYVPRLDSLALGDVPVGGVARATVLVLNSGDAPLRARMASAFPGVTVRPDTLDVPVNGRSFVEVTFAPLALGDAHAVVTFDTNDPARRHVELGVRGRGVLAPRMETAPGSIVAGVGPGGDTHVSWRVRNTGAGALRFTARAEWDGWGGAVAPLLPGPAMPPGPAGPAAPDDDLDAEALSSTPWSVACLVADPSTGYLYGLELDGTRFARYRPVTREWEILSSAPLSANEYAAAVLMRGRLYFGSASGFTTTTTLGVFDLATESWGTLKLQTVSSTGALAGDGRRFLYLIDDEGLVRVDPETREETALGATSIPHAIGAPLRYAAGMLYGHDAGPDATTVHRYDIAAGTWSQAPDPPGPLGLGGAIDPVHGELVIPAWGGDVQYRLDLATGAWRATRLPYFAAATGVMAWIPGDEAGLYVAQGSAGQRFAREPHAARLAPVPPATWDVPPGGEADIDLRLAPADLHPGARAFDLALEGNDPAALRTTVPVSVTVTARPRIEIGGVWRSGSLVRLSTAVAATEHVLSTLATPVGPVTLSWFQADRYANPWAPTELSLDGRAVDSLATAGFGCGDASSTRAFDDAWIAEAMRDGVLRATVLQVASVSCGPVRRWVQCAYPAAGLPLDLPAATAGDTVVTRARVANTGNVPLSITAVASDHPDLRVVGAPLSVPPGGEDVLVLEWTPRSAGPLVATVTIDSDDPDQARTVGAVRGVALAPPTVAVVPEELRVHVFPGETETRALILVNRGGRALSWSGTIADPAPDETRVAARGAGVTLESPSWITLAPPAGTVAPGETSRVVVTFDAHGVADGRYETVLAFTSNDPERPALEVPARVFVGAALVAGVRIEPRVLQPRGSGRWIAAHVTAPAGLADAAVRAGTLRLNDGIAPDSVPAAGTGRPYAFDRNAVIASLPDGEWAELRIRGELEDGRRFEGRDTVRVLRTGTTLPEGEPAAGAVVFALEASPNPFRDAARIAFALPSAGEVRLEVFDLAGRRVLRLVDGALEAGRHVVAWDGRSPTGRWMPAGVYVVRLQASGQELRRRVVRSR